MTDDRRYPRRPITGVGALIFRGDREILLVERGRPPLAGKWSLPGGCVETGERLEEAVAREVLEETGLRVEAVSLATVFERIMPDGEGRCEYHYILVDFYCTIKGGVLSAGDDSSDARWFDLADLAALTMTAGTREVIELCAAGHGLHPVVTRP